MAHKQFIFVASALILLQSGAFGDSPYHNTNCADGRVAIVHLFEWKFADIARECENFLSPMGFCGVQTSPVHENAIIRESWGRPWWERYQPISYVLTSRSGNENQLRDMIRRCNNVGVRVYIDVILNHMSGVGRQGTGTGGSYFESSNGHFPAVPYTMDNFNSCDGCTGCCCINSWTDLTMVRNCRLEGLIDLDGSQEYVRQKQAEYLNKLISFGVAGFRIDAAKHMWPNNINAVLTRLNNLNTEFFPGGRRPFIMNEVIDMNQNGEIRAQEYVHLGKVTEFRYSSKIRETVYALWSIPGLYDPGWGMLDPDDAFVFVDNHDSQRGHGAGNEVFTFKQAKEYKMAQAITHAWTYGQPRIMSSYEFTNTEAGPPSNGDTIRDVTFDGNGNPQNGWVAEHRWQVIAGMASFAKAVSGTTDRFYWNQGNAAAWARGDRGFFAITNEGGMNQWMQTGLPAGQYCNVIQGCPTSNGCAGDTITVENDGMANIRINNNNEPMLAIHVEARSGSNGCIN